MKTLSRLFIALFITTTFIGCSSDDDGGNDTSASLVGTWNITSLVYGGENTFEVLGESSSSSFQGVGQNFDASVIFTENPNEFVSSGSYDVVLDFEVEGVSETTTTSIDNFQSEGSWERNGSILSFEGSLVEVDTTVPVVMGSNMNDATILELTETTLRLGQVVSQEISEDGITVSINFTSETTFTRQ